MLATTPIPTAVPKPASTGPIASPAAPAAPGATPKVDDAPVVAAPAGQAADGAKQQTPAPNGGAAPADAAAAKAAIIEKLQKTSAADAIAQVDDHLGKLATLSVGGGTPEGTEGAKVASALLTDSSMLLQHAHMKAMEQLRDMATELHIRLMSSASGLAYMGGQVAIAGQSKTAIKLADIAAGPITETKATIADVIDAITPKDAPKTDAPPADVKPADVKPTDAKPATADGTPPNVDPTASRIGAPTDAPVADKSTIPVPNSPNGNTGVAGGLQHVTPGPGVGPGPHPA